MIPQPEKFALEVVTNSMAAIANCEMRCMAA